MSSVRHDRPPDWADTVSGTLRRKGRRAREVSHEALSRAPLWLGAAMAVRHLLVRPIRLKGAPPGAGHVLACLPVVTDIVDHVETGVADRHLTFTAALRINGDRADATTSIWFNRQFGCVYRWAVMPGHILIVRQLMGRVATGLRRTLGAPVGLMS